MKRHTWFVVMGSMLSVWPMSLAHAGGCGFTSEDDFGNTICVKKYKYPDGKWDTTLTLTLKIGQNQKLPAPNSKSW